LETGKAWASKELFRDLWHHRKQGVATRHLKDGYNWVIYANLELLWKVARTIREWLAIVVNYFFLGITNAVAEGTNSKIIAIKRKVGGYRNREKLEKRSILIVVDRISSHDNPGWP
jgi:transposase